MGLIKDLKEYKKRKEFLSLLAEFGITEADLTFLPEAIKYIKAKQVEEATKPVGVTPPKEVVDKYKKIVEEKKTVEDFVDSFSDDVEEFYPNGIPN